MDPVYADNVKNDNIDNGLINRPTYGNEKHLPKFSCYIGEFHKGTLSTNVKSVCIS